MTGSQFDQLINGIALLAAENHIANVLSYMTACNAKVKRAYADVSYVYATAEQFKQKILGWDLRDEFDYDQFLEETFGKVPSGH